MYAGNLRLQLPRVPFRGACFELFEEMAPLEVNLALGNRNPAGGRRGGDPCGVEAVSAVDRFRVNGPQILSDERNRTGLFAKRQQLRMMPIAPGFALQHRLGEQSLAP